MSFGAANIAHKDVAKWHSTLATMRSDLCDKWAIENRAYDLYRNNDYMRGMVEKQVDAIVGPKTNVQLMPNHKEFGVSKQEAQAWARNAEDILHSYIHSPENWVSSNRVMDFTQFARSLARYNILSGEMMVSREWRPSPMGINTCFNLISPKRVRNPNIGSFGASQPRMVEGIELDRYGAPKAYRIEQIRAGETTIQSNGMEFKRVAIRNSFGFMQFFHVFEPMMAEYTRGISQTAASLIRHKKVERLEDADLDKAIITSNYAITITSDESPESVSDMLAGIDSDRGSDFALPSNQEASEDADKAYKRDQILGRILEERFIETHGAQLMHLFKGEDAKVLAAPNTIGTMDSYVSNHKRAIANSLGMGYEFATGDFKGLNFSAGQLTMGINDHNINIKRKVYIHKVLRLMVRSLLDELISRGIIPLLGNKPYFPNKEAYTRCEFTGARRVHVDPVKKSRSQVMDLASGTTSRTQIAEENGDDFESIIESRGQEALQILTTIDAAAESEGLKLTAAQKLKVITDVISTETVELPPEMEMEAEET